MGKKIRLFFKTFTALMLVCFVLLPGTVEAADNGSGVLFRSEPPTESVSSVIAFATDLHINPKASYTGELNPFYAYNREITRALLFDIQNAGVDYLVLCGDISNAGRPEQHEELLAILATLRDSGIRIFVIDGNHDIGTTTTADFARLYADYGYSDAHSRDSGSLSYSHVLPDQLLLMIDTGGYDNRGLSGNLSDDTISWVEEQLVYAAELELPVTAVGHYPLLARQSGDFTGADKLARLLEEYNVPIYVCGHLHGRSTYSTGSLTELVVEQTVSYPCSYALVSRYGNGGLLYHPRMIDVSLWAENDPAGEPLFTDFNNYREIAYTERCRQLVLQLKGEKSFSAGTVNSAGDFYSAFARSSSQGRMYWDAAELKNHPGYKSFLRISEGTIYSRWVPSVLENPSPYSGGFLIEEGSVYALMPAQ